jgi:hypothetical protein
MAWLAAVRPRDFRHVRLAASQLGYTKIARPGAVFVAAEHVRLGLDCVLINRSDVRFARKATELLRDGGVTRRAMKRHMQCTKVCRRSEVRSATPGPVTKAASCRTGRHSAGLPSRDSSPARRRPAAEVNDFMRHACRRSQGA